MKDTNTYNTLKYSLIAFPLAFAGIPIYLHAPDYYVTNIGIKIEIIGFTLLLLRLVDAILDPLIGSLSDHFYKYRDKIIYLGSFLLILGFWMIFHPPNINIILWFSLSVFLCTLGFSIIAINIQAFGGLWDIPAPQVTKIIVTREAVGIFGLLVASIVPSLLYLTFKDNNFHILSIILIFIMMISLMAFYSWIKSSEIKSPIKPNNSRSMRVIFINKKVRLFFTSYFFSCFASAIPATLIIFYVRDYLLAEKFLGLFLLVYFASGALSMPIWKNIATRFNCASAWFYSMVFAAFSFIWAFFLQPNDIQGFFAICLFSGMAVGANLGLPSAIIAEFISSNKNENYAASYYSISNFLSKFALAIASGIALPILGFMGYEAGIARTDNLFPFTYAFLPCVFQIISILLLRRIIASNNG
tara:strand:- start:382 stop:1626 length:1245 start_codon:yes stop_codon:yes gene_type:complete